MNSSFMISVGCCLVFVAGRSPPFCPSQFTNMIFGCTYVCTLFVARQKYMTCRLATFFKVAMSRNVIKTDTTQAGYILEVCRSLLVCLRMLCLLASTLSIHCAPLPSSTHYMLMEYYACVSSLSALLSTHPLVSWQKEFHNSPLT